jgi:hypothetical protein
MDLSSQTNSLSRTYQFLFGSGMHNDDCSLCPNRNSLLRVFHKKTLKTMTRQQKLFLRSVFMSMKYLLTPPKLKLNDSIKLRSDFKKKIPAKAI